VVRTFTLSQFSKKGDGAHRKKIAEVDQNQIIDLVEEELISSQSIKSKKLLNKNNTNFNK
jgi:hypothetical protein